ncbi:MAG: MFS transporter [Myxococcota bacterium]|nr:MFS transporter [Myxococcota bacterium]
MRPLYWLSAYAHFFQASWAILSPHVAREFGLDDARITFLAGVASLGAFGTFALARLADRRGRRGVLLACFATLPAFCVATALAPGQLSFSLAQIGISAFSGGLMSLVAVMIAEEIEEGARAEGQAWFGLFGFFGSALPFLIVATVEDMPSGWRWVWVAGALPLLALPLLRRRLPETRRFERVRDAGDAARSRAGDLFAGRYRRRTVGLLLAGTLRPVAITASLTWSIYHMAGLGFSALETMGVLGASGLLGMAGIALGARLANRWGRRPTAATASGLSIVTAVAFYWVPLDAPLHPALWLGLTFGLCQLAIQAFGVADRCLDTELFPTRLRATYAGWTRIAVAVASTGAHFAVSGLTLWLGGLVEAITVLSLSTITVSLVIFLAVCPETRGLTLETAALEEPASIEPR